MLNKLFSYITLSLFLLAGILLGGCRANVGNLPGATPGSWENNGHIYEYRDDGTLYYDGGRVNYQVIGDGRVRINGTGGRNSNFDMYNYSFNKDGSLSMNNQRFYPWGQSGLAS